MCGMWLADSVRSAKRCRTFSRGAMRCCDHGSSLHDALRRLRQKLHSLPVCQSLARSRIANCVVAGHTVVIAVRCRAGNAAQILLPSGAHVVWAPSIVEDRPVYQQGSLPSFVQYVAVHLFWLRCGAVPRAVACGAAPSVVIPVPVAMRCAGPGPPVSIVPPVAAPIALLVLPLLSSCAGPVAA